MPTEYLTHGGTVYQLLSFYALPDDAWSIELTDMSSEGGPLAHVLVPDEDMERPCEVLALDPSRIPTDVLRRLLVEVAESARHAGATFVSDQHDPPLPSPSATVTGTPRTSRSRSAPAGGEDDLGHV